MKRLLVLFVTAFFVGCSFFDTKKDYEHTVVDTIVDFEKVDAFPLFPSCDSIPSREKQEVCFKIKVSQHIYKTLQQQEFKVSRALQDTAFVKIIVHIDGTSRMQSLKTSDNTKKLLPQLDSILGASIAQLPIMKPAIKRAFPVKTAFTLPIIISNFPTEKPE